MKKHGIESKFEYAGDLGAVLIRKDGSHRDIGRVSGPENFRLIGRPIQWWRGLWHKLRMQKIIPITLGFATFLSLYGVVDQPYRMAKLFQDARVAQIIMGNLTNELGLVVTGGANFLATDMASGQASPRISAMNFHDSGTGTTAATSTDSGLQTAAGPTTRATGTQSNPATNQYRSIGTIAYTGTLSITEWALFNIATRGGGGEAMWDRRTFSVISVGDGDSIQFTYTLTVTAGGS